MFLIVGLCTLLQDVELARCSNMFQCSIYMFHSTFSGLGHSGFFESDFDVPDTLASAIENRSILRFIFDVSYMFIVGQIILAAITAQLIDGSLAHIHTCACVHSLPLHVCLSLFLSACLLLSLSRCGACAFAHTNFCLFFLRALLPPFPPSLLPSLLFPLPLRDSSAPPPPSFLCHSHPFCRTRSRFHLLAVASSRARALSCANKRSNLFLFTHSTHACTHIPLTQGRGSGCLHYEQKKLRRSMIVKPAASCVTSQVCDSSKQASFSANISRLYMTLSFTFTF